MASWMIHLRIADALFDRLVHIDTDAFVMGSIAPDSGKPNADGSGYIPSKDLSHFKLRGEDGKSRISPEEFAKEYFSEEKRNAYSLREYSFYLGYLVHLLTDVLWVEKILKRDRLLYAKEISEDKSAFMNRCKEDWYDLDHLFIKRNPDFRAFSIYRNTKSFHNTYIDFFSEKAFESRKEYVVEFYLEEQENLDREYKYFSEERAEAFVSEGVREIIGILRKAYGVCTE